MQPDAVALLWDDRRAAQLILDFVAGRSWPEYQIDPMLRSAVERQFEIVAFRNVLVHGYATIGDVLVWEVATTRVKPLVATLDDLLREPR
jgi:uncharacterized protein with HEPN domain